MVLGLQADASFFVAHDGPWICSYTPALFRACPFRLAKVQGQENLSLVVDEDGGISNDGEPFLDEEGKSAPKLAEFIEFLTTIEQGRLKANEGVKELDEAVLIDEWPLTIKSEDGKEQKIRALYRVAEQKFTGSLHLPHRDVEYQAHEAVVSIPDGEVMEGSLPPKKLRTLQRG